MNWSEIFNQGFKKGYSIMDSTKQLILNEWLEIEFYTIANRIGFISKEKRANKNLIYQTIRCLDYETTMKRAPETNYVITVIGLMWEHTDHEIYDLRQIIIKFLSRIGYPTSAIVCDKNFDKDTSSFRKLDSWLDELVLTMYQELNEIEICGHAYLLTNFQKSIWDSMENDKILGISAPTSAGKSFVILLRLLKMLNEHHLDVVYIVPTLSLVNQVTEDFNRGIKKLNIKNCLITNNFVLDDYKQYNTVYVITQEKAIEAFSEYADPFPKKLILVADEIQNIERMVEEHDERSKILFDSLIEFGQKNNVDQVVVSGPRIDNISDVGKCIFGEETIRHATEISPVLNLTYSIKKNGSEYFFKQYCKLNKIPIVKRIENIDMIRGYGKIRLSDEYLVFLDKFVDSVGNGTQNIIFASTPASARKIAVRLGGSIQNPERELIKYYKETVHDNYALCTTLLNGVAYHHGKLPMHVRRTLEKAISDNRIPKVVCTTTLLQGVNLPAQNVFIRNPHLYLKRTTDSTELSAYEMANLRGRAGRLLKEYIGRTFVLDEDSFSGTNEFQQEALFSDTTKVLPTGYEKVFKENYHQIEEALIKNDYMGIETTSYGYLVSYIRQNVLRYGDNAKSRLRNVGIKLTSKQIAAIKLKLNTISIPKELCYRNRYWDPLVLNLIYNNFKGDVPRSPYDCDVSRKIDCMLSYLRDTTETSVMYEKNIPSKYQRGKNFKIMVMQCKKWARGVELKQILGGDYYNLRDGKDEDKIDATIDLLQSTISFKIPLLLKPIFDMKSSQNIFLSCMRAGATETIARTMIEMGIARETALYLYKRYFNNISGSENDKIGNEQIIRDTLKYIYDDVPYWIQVQLDFLL